MNATAKRRRAPGPVAELAAVLGYRSMTELAAALRENPATVRGWNMRGAIPARAAAAVERLRLRRGRS